MKRFSCLPTVQNCLIWLTYLKAEKLIDIKYILQTGGGKIAPIAHVFYFNYPTLSPYVQDILKNLNQRL